MKTFSEFLNENSFLSLTGGKISHLKLYFGEPDHITRWKTSFKIEAVDESQVSFSENRYN